MIETVFLDAGNTLVGIEHRLFAEVLRARGTEFDEPSIARAEAAARPALSRFIASGVSTEGTAARDYYLRTALEQLEVPESRLDELASAITALLSVPETADRVWLRVLPGVPEALDELRRRGLRIAVVSNSDGRVAERLARADLLERVDEVVDSGRVGCEKPDPRIFQIAMERTGTRRPERCVHVGDLYHVDILGARAAGIAGLLVDPYGDWGEFDCETIRGVPELLERI